MTAKCVPLLHRLSWLTPVILYIRIVTAGSVESPYDGIAAGTEVTEINDPHPRIPTTVSKYTSKTGQFEGVIEFLSLLLVVIYVACYAGMSLVVRFCSDSR